MTSNYISYESAIDLLSWEDSVAALRAGHLAPKAEIADIFLGPQTATLLNRAAFIDGLGYGVKAVTVMGENPTKGLPTVQGAMMVYAPDTGGLSARLSTVALSPKSRRPATQPLAHVCWRDQRANDC